MPTLKPVKEPGPQATAIPSSSCIESAEVVKSWSMVSRSLDDTVLSKWSTTSARRRPESVREAEQLEEEVSIVKIFTNIPGNKAPASEVSLAVA
jgi:hypothetical protein